MINWFGGTAPVDFRHGFDETWQVAAGRIPVSRKAPQ
jgi:mannose-6-phosphate isomerase-like protein (cupin superfamily)